MNGRVENTVPPQRACDVLSRVFGFDRFREGQEDVIERLLAGRSVLAIFPTGGGKSLCYQLPALILDGLTLVISPLIALMKDQIDFLTARGVPAARLDSSLGLEETRAVFDAMHSGRLKLLYVSPERLGNERFLRSLEHRTISLLAVDEAHCISEWGHNFRPDYLKIAGLAEQFRAGRVLALTATATPEVAKDIAVGFKIAQDDVIHTGFHRPNLTLYVTPCQAGDRNDLLLSRLRKRRLVRPSSTSTLQRTAEEVAKLLSAAGFDARAYHAGMEAEDRAAVQDAFMKSERKIIVATIAFGMGIDKANIRSIYHYNLPKGLENYAQETGRAGRDGQPSICEMLACPDDVVVLENFAYGDTPTAEAVETLVADLLDRGPAFDVSIYELSQKYDVRPLVVETLITYLELEGVLRATGPFYAEFKFQPRKPSREILARFDPARADFLRKIFQRAEKGKTWFKLDVPAIGRDLGEPRERIVTALNYLEERGDLVLQAAGVRHGYRLLSMPQDPGELATMLSGASKSARTTTWPASAACCDSPRNPAASPAICWPILARKSAPAGTAADARARRGNRSRHPATLHPGSPRRMRCAQLRAEKLAALTAPRQVARFLCGIASPATTRAKLRRHPMFGTLETVPFREVLAFVEKCWG